MARIKNLDKKDVALAIIALLLMVSTPTAILPFVSAAAATTGIGVVAFWVSYTIWAGLCLYESITDPTGAFISCTIGYIAVL